MSLLGAFFGSKPTDTVATNLLDMVSNAASLASNAQDIDPLLDKMRATTSHLVPGAIPPLADQKTILSVYLAIEKYLISKDPIRTFSQESLRQRLSTELREQLTAYENEGKGMVQ